MEEIHTFLLQAIEGESGAERKYEAFARKAREEKFHLVGALFSALAQAEAIHCANHIRALEKNGYTGAVPENEEEVRIGDTLANLDEAIAAEYDEFHNLYPSFRRTIGKKYGSRFTAKIALLSMQWAGESEEGHHNLLRQAREAVAEGTDITGGMYYVCRVCGNIEFFATPPEKECTVCGHDVSFFTEYSATTGDRDDGL